MIQNIIEQPLYKDLMSSQIKQIIEYLQDNSEGFSITANIQGVSFEPELPAPISQNFAQFTLFTLANYTFESLQIEDDYITFEAGFGEENFGSFCTIPYFAIFQISMEGSILHINPTATIQKYFLDEIDEDEQQQRSMNAFKASFK